MGNPDTDKVFAGSIPKLYETYLVPLIFEPYAADLVNRLASRSLTRVLEIAAGTGVVTRALASELPEGVSIVATDLNQPMLDQAFAVGTKRPVEWRQADAMQLPFRDETLDAVVCQFGVMFFPEKSKAFSEARRVLRSGGIFIFNTWDRIKENEFADTVTTALESLFPKDPPRFLARTPHGYYDRPTIERDLADGGFTVSPQITTVAARSRAKSFRVPAIAYCQGGAAPERDRGARRLAARRSNGHCGGSYRAAVRAGECGRQDPGTRCHHRKLTVANCPCTALGDLRGRHDMSTSDEKTREGIAPTLPPPMQLFLMSEGVVVSTALSLAAELGIADLLADGPRSGDELAQTTSTHPRSLHRVLRLLSSVGVFTEVQPGRFALTSLGECLRTGVPGSMRSWLRMVGLKVWFHTYGEALHSLRTGEPAFARTVGTELFDYLATHPEEGEIFNSAMSDFGQGVAAAVLQGYDFDDVETVVDVGGGNGSFISSILRANPRMTGILFDLPHVVERARKSIVDAGLTKRCDIAGGDFFMSIPAGGDAYVLRWIIHDWDHDRALTILRNCREAMKSTARLLLVETVIPAGDEPHPGKLVDFVMLTALGGQERTAEEYERLLDEAGFRLKTIVPTASPMSVVEGRLR